jgi:hypothetical protein
MFLEIGRGHQMLANRTRITGTQPVVKTFVVRVIKTGALQFPFKVPIHFRDEQKSWMRLSDLADRFGPKRIVRR